MCLIVSPDGAEGSIQNHQDARLFTGLFEAGLAWPQRIEVGRKVWLHVAQGPVHANGNRLEESRAALVEEDRDPSPLQGGTAPFRLALSLPWAVWRPGGPAFPSQTIGSLGKSLSRRCLSLQSGRKRSSRARKRSS
ncbi:pirin family protein [Methylacidimicrobium cyclopophantes]|uniref:pirin family protein n=1 Tax=Methylacidimicrobium cyclopophantes TaxID=1041766 RepID=UPI001FE920C6|nr:hypothetical protein [Methylacidimicrobium cyclopophantes]